MGKPVAVVLGAAGFIGRHLAHRLHADGWDDRGFDVKWATDLRDPAEALGAVEGAEVVFHLAADMGGVGYFHRHDYRPYLNNARITMNVLDACEQQHVNTLVYASSACAYPTEGQRSPARTPRLTEQTLELGYPDQMYGREKLMGLRLCERAPFDARVAILHTVYGPGQEYEGERAKFPPSVAYKAVQARETGRLDVWGDGQQRRSYLYVDDAVDMLCQVAFDGYDGPVNVGYEGAVSCDDVARLCLDVAGADAEIVHTDDGPTGVVARDCSLAKWTATYGTAPKVGLREGFGRLIGWIDDFGGDADDPAAQGDARRAAV